MRCRPFLVDPQRKGTFSSSIRRSPATPRNFELLFEASSPALTYCLPLSHGTFAIGKPIPYPTVPFSVTLPPRVRLIYLAARALRTAAALRLTKRGVLLFVRPLREPVLRFLFFPPAAESKLSPFRATCFPALKILNRGSRFFVDLTDFRCLSLPTRCSLLSRISRVSGVSDISLFRE